MPNYTEEELRAFGIPCGTCIRMVAQVCRDRGLCCHREYSRMMTEALEERSDPGFEWYADPPKPDDSSR